MCLVQFRLAFCLLELIFMCIEYLSGCSPKPLTSPEEYRARSKDEKLGRPVPLNQLLSA